MNFAFVCYLCISVLNMCCKCIIYYYFKLNNNSECVFPVMLLF